MILVPLNIENKVTILRSKHSTDKVKVTFVGGSPFLSNEDYMPSFTIETTQGYAETWIEENLGLDESEYEVINID